MSKTHEHDAQIAKNERVRLQSVEIKKLFNKFNYTFDYTNDEDVSIVTAPNGCGKTTIFKFIDFILCPSPESLQSIIAVPYEKVACKLSNGVIVGVEKKFVGMGHDNMSCKSDAYTNYDRYSAIGEWGDGDFDQDEDFSLTNSEVKFYDIIYSESLNGNIRKFSFYNCIERDCVVNDEESEENSFEQNSKHGKKTIKGFSEKVLEFIGEMAGQAWVKDDLWADRNAKIHGIGGSGMMQEIIKWRQLPRELRLFIQKKDYPKAEFIRANRTANILVKRESSPSFRSRESKVELSAMEQIEHSIATLIKSAMKDYDNLIDSVKNNLPKRYIKDGISKSMDKQEFVAKWKEYCDEVNRYHDIGLFSTNMTDLDISEVEKSYDSKSDFLQIYLSEYQRTLEPLRELYSRLELYANIINKRNEITHKLLKFNKDNGVYIECDGVEMPLRVLSSGEQNDIVMFYRLIFECDDKTLILIDEPEISLHVEWQEQYVDRLIELCKINGSQAIVATHSPDIINNHFDLCAKKVMSYEE